MRAPPDTSNANCGAVVRIPTLPPVYHTFPAVFAVHPVKTSAPFWYKPPVIFTFAAVRPVAKTNADPTVTLFIKKLLKVAFVNKPFDPVTLVASSVPNVPVVDTMFVAVTFVNVPVEEYNAPAVIFRRYTLPIVASDVTSDVPVAFVKSTLPSVPVVLLIPVSVAELVTKELAVIFVRVKFVTVEVVNWAFAPTIEPVDNADVTVRSPVVILPETTIFVELTLVARTFAMVTFVNCPLLDVMLFTSTVPAVKPVVTVRLVAVIPVNNALPMLVSVACKFVLVTFVATTLPVVTEFANRLSVVTFVNVPLVDTMDPAVNVPVTASAPDVKPVVTSKLVAVTLVACTFEVVAFVDVKLDVLIFVPTNEPTVKLDKLKFDNVTFVASIFVTVALLALTFVASTFVNAPVPETSNVYAGLVVLIPILPPVKKILPIVLDDPTTVNPELTYIVPTDKFVSTKLVVVKFVMVSVPDTVRFPDKFNVPPVITVATKFVVVTFARVAFVLTSVPAVKDVPSKLAEVIVLAAKLAVLTLVVARTFPSVAPVPITILPAETFVTTALVTVAFVAFIVPVLNEDVTANELTVSPVVSTSVPTVKLPAKFKLPSVTVRYAGDTNGTDLLEGNAIREVITRLPVPEYETATKMDSSGLQHTLLH